MAGEISIVSGPAAEGVSAPAVPSPGSSGSHRKTETASPSPTQATTDDGSFLAAVLERVHHLAPGSTTTISFERDGTDGKMYVHIKDKDTGEEILRIPRNYLANTDPSLWQPRQVDVLV